MLKLLPRVLLMVEEAWRWQMVEEAGTSHTPDKADRVKVGSHRLLLLLPEEQRVVVADRVLGSEVEAGGCGRPCEGVVCRRQ